MNWPLAYSSNAFTRTDLASALRAIADLGFAGAEILCDIPHCQPDRVNDQSVDQIAGLLRRHGLAVSNLNANTANGFFSPPPAENTFEPALSSANSDHRRWRIDYSKAAIDLAARLGAPCISVTSGMPGSGGPPEQGLELFVDSLRDICAHAQQNGIRVGIEYEPGLLVERASEARTVIERVGSPQLGVNLDIGHSYLDGEAPEEAIEQLTGRIWNVHVEDIAKRKHYHLVPGLGDLPFQRYFKALRQADYQGFLTVELYTYVDQPEQAGRESLAYLSRLLESA